MSTENSYNPYEPPLTDAKGTVGDMDAAILAVLRVSREPLTEFERKCFRFSVERSSVEKSNASKLAIAEHVEATLENPLAIFANLKRENFEQAFA